MTNQELIILKILLRKALKLLEKEDVESPRKVFKQTLIYSEQDFIRKILLNE
jgi:hypothetical protein